MSPFAKGVALAVTSVLGGSIAIALLIVGFEVSFEISNEALAVIAQVGATLLVAYAVETAWFIKASRSRGKDRENWVGFVTGIGLSSAIGIGLAIAFIGSTSTSFIETLAGTWMIFSLVLLGLVVALMPYVLYEWVHAVHAQYPDE